MNSAVRGGIKFNRGVERSVKKALRRYHGACDDIIKAYKASAPSPRLLNRFYLRNDELGAVLEQLRQERMRVRV